MTSMHFCFPLRSMSVLVLAGALALLTGCGGQDQQRQMPPARVGVVVVQPQTVPLIRDATGRLSAFRSADVRARTSGVLLTRTYDEGSHVDKGQKLFQIDPAPLKAQLSAAEAALAQARATYTNARVAAERANKLAPKGYISKSALDDAEAKARTAAAAVKAAEAQVQSARISLGYATVQAPISGRAGKQQVTEGALVGQGAATLLTTVRQIDPMYVTFAIPVGRLQQLRAAQASGRATLSGTSKAGVTLTLPGGGTYAHRGTLDFAGASVDPSTGAVTLRAIIPNPEHVLLPGMYANLKVDMGHLNSAFLIPQGAVLRDGNSAYVLTVGKGNKVVRTNITTNGQLGGDWIVTDGVAAGDRVIVSGLPKAKPGAEVKPVIQTGKAGATGNKPASKPTTTAAPATSASSPSPKAAGSAGKPTTQS